NNSQYSIISRENSNDKRTIKLSLPFIFKFSNYHISKFSNPQISTSTNRSFQRNCQQFLRFYGKLHRQLIQHLFGITIYDQAHSFLRIDPALVQIEDLIFSDFGGRSLML